MGDEDGFRTWDIYGDFQDIVDGAYGASLGVIGIEPAGSDDLGFCVVGGLGIVGRSQAAIEP